MAATTTRGGVMLSLDLHLDRGKFRLNIQTEIGDGVTALFGPSGSGKSTLLQLIAGLLRPQRGRLALQDRVLVDSQQHRFVPAHKRKVGVVFQDARLFPHLTVRGNLQFARRHANRPSPIDQDRLVDLLELGPVLSRQPHTLSGGEAQRVALGRALLSAPQLLLLDEPLAALDRRLRRQILPFLRTLREQIALPMIYVSHDLGELLQLTDQMLVLNSGRIVGQGRYRDLLLDDEGPELGENLLNVLPLLVVKHDRSGGMTDLAPVSGPGANRTLLRAPLRDIPTGSRVSIALRPEDIALALAPVSDTSIQNQLEGTITKIAPRSGQRVIEIDVGVPLLAEVTQRTAHKLRLQPEKKVWCLIKSNAVKYLEG